MNWENWIDIYTLAGLKQIAVTLESNCTPIKKKLQKKKKKEWVGEINSISELDLNLLVASFLAYFLYIFIYFFLLFHLSK